MSRPKTIGRVLVAPLSGYPAIARLQVDDPQGMSEISCTWEQSTVLVPWINDTKQSTRVLALPFEEFTRAPWSRNYRWTVDADATYRENLARFARRLAGAA
jgi:hypothetical protein